MKPYITYDPSKFSCYGTWIVGEPLAPHGNTIAIRVVDRGDSVEDIEPGDVVLITEWERRVVGKPGIGGYTEDIDFLWATRAANVIAVIRPVDGDWFHFDAGDPDVDA